MGTAVKAARRLIAGVPPALRRAPAGVDVSATRAAWQNWERARDADPEKLADALDLTHPDLAELAPTVAELRGWLHDARPLCADLAACR
jgi:hypothetical protein